MAHVLVIDDDDHVRSLVRRILEAAGYCVTEAADGQQGLEAFLAEPPDVVITDIFMPKREGLETIMALRREDRSVRIIAVSGGGERGALEHLQTADKLGAMRTLCKPFHRVDLLAAVEEAIHAPV
jgi:DNA-binding response OmpR family regulator